MLLINDLIAAIVLSFRFLRCALGNEHRQHTGSEVLQEAWLQAPPVLTEPFTSQQCHCIGTTSVKIRQLAVLVVLSRVVAYVLLR